MMLGGGGDTMLRGGERGHCRRGRDTTSGGGAGGGGTWHRKAGRVYVIRLTGPWGWKPDSRRAEGGERTDDRRMEIKPFYKWNYQKGNI